MVLLGGIAPAFAADTASIGFALAAYPAAQVNDVKAGFIKSMKERGLSPSQIDGIRFIPATKDMQALRQAVAELRKEGAKVLFVPTFVLLEALLPVVDRPPIVFITTVSGLFESLPDLASPAKARATGVNAWGPGHVESKMLELLMLARKPFRKVCVLGTAASGADDVDSWLQRHAQSLAVTLQFNAIGRLDDLRRLIARGAIADCDGFIVFMHRAVADWPREYIDALNALGVPAIYASAAFARMGGLLSIEPDAQPLREHAMDQVVAVLRGTSLASLPVAEPDGFRVGINVPSLRFLRNPPEKRLLLRATDFYYD